MVLRHSGRKLYFVVHSSSEKQQRKLLRINFTVKEPLKSVSWCGSLCSSSFLHEICNELDKLVFPILLNEFAASVYDGPIDSHINEKEIIAQRNNKMINCNSIMSMTHADAAEKRSHKWNHDKFNQLKIHQLTTHAQHPAAQIHRKKSQRSPVTR